MKILRTTDLVTIKTNDIELDVSPMTYEQNIEYENLTTIDAGEVKVNTMQKAKKLIEFCVKEVRGVKDFNDDDMILKAPFDANTLSDVLRCLSNSTIGQSVSLIALTGSLYDVKGVEYVVNGKAVNMGKQNKKA